MAAPKQSFDLDDEFERYGPVDDVDAFIDSQFKFATEDEEEMYGSSRDETQTIRSKIGTQADGCASTGSTLDSFDLSFASDTLINIPLSPPEEPHTPLCSRCRESMESEGADGWARSKVMTASESLEETKGCVGVSEIETTSDPRNAEVTEMQLVDISEDVGTCWRELGPKLEIAASKIHNLDEECNNNWEKANALLLTWKQQEGRCATVARLANYLESIKRKSIAEKLRGISDIQLPIVSTASQGVIISLTVGCTLNADPDTELMLCTDVQGNKYILKACHNSVGDWNSEEIQKNRQFLETVATATQEMGKTAEQRRQESLKRISTEVQELRRQLKRSKLDSYNTESGLDSVFSDPSESKESSKEPQDDANEVSHQDAANMLQSCKEQCTFCQRMYDALIKLIGEIGQPRDDNFKCIKELYEFTKELKDREKTVFSKIKQLCGQKPHLDELQVIQVKELEKWSRTQEAQIEGVEKLLSSLFTQGQKQNHLKRRSAPGLGGGKSSNAFGRRRRKTDSSKNLKSQSLSEFPDDSRKNDISGPVERVKEEGVTWYLEQGSVRITFHPGAVKQPTLINCSLWSPRVLSPPLHCNEALVSNVIEVSLDNAGDAKGEVTVALLHSACEIEGYELVIKQLVDPDNKEWIDLKTQGIWHVSGSSNRPMNFAEASCLLTCRSVFAVIWRLKSFQFSRQNSVAPDFTCILPDYPDVSVTIPSNSVPVNEDFCLTVKVHEFRSSKVQTERLFFGPVLHISCSPNVTLLEAATIKIPLSLHEDKGLLDTDLSSGHLRILHYSSTKEGSPTWTEITQTLETNATVTEGIVTLQVKHFSRFALVMDWVGQTFAVVRDIVSDLYRRVMAQWAGFKAYLCQDADPNKYVLTLFCYPIHLESKVKDLSSEHVVVMQGEGTSSIPLCEQDTMSVHLSESFSVKQEILERFCLMFWEKEPNHNSLRVNQVVSTDLNVTLIPRWKGEETPEVCTLCLIPRSHVQVSPHATFENWPHGDLFNREENMPQRGRSPGLTVKEGNPTRVELESLAARIGEKWKPLGRRLNFDDSSLTGFDKDHSEYREKVYAMLSEWKQQGGAINATYQILYEALCHELVACRDLAETFCCQ